MPLPEGTEYAGYAKRDVPDVSYDADTNRIERTGGIPAGGTAEIAFDLKVAESAETGDVIAPGEWYFTYDGDGVNDTALKPEDVETVSDSASSGVTGRCPEQARMSRRRCERRRRHHAGRCCDRAAHSDFR